MTSRLWKLTLFLLAAVSLVTEVTSPSAAPAAQSQSMKFSATDGRPEFTQSLGPHLVLKIRSAVDAKGRRFGWDLSVTDRRLGDRPNFFYDCLCGHGPRPHDLYAWHFRDMIYPARRILPVYGYPFEVSVECKECRVEGDTATDNHFTAGIVEVTWRRLPKSNPRQQTLADFRKSLRSR